MSTVSSGSEVRHETDRFAAGLRAAGLKLTAQRVAICRTLSEMEGREHPTVQEIFEAAQRYHAGVSLATVYNTLTVLKGQGLVYELGPDLDGAVHYELDTSTHVNVVCVQCRRIVDLHFPSDTRLETNVVEATGFRLIGGQVLYYGFCPECGKRETSPAS